MKNIKFNFRKWVTENKFGKQPHLFEQERGASTPADDKDDKKDDKKADKKDDKPSTPKKDDKPSKPKKDDKPRSKPKKIDFKGGDPYSGEPVQYVPGTGPGRTKKPSSIEEQSSGCTSNMIPGTLTPGNCMYYVTIKQCGAPGYPTNPLGQGNNASLCGAANTFIQLSSPPQQGDIVELVGSSNTGFHRYFLWAADPTPVNGHPYGWYSPSSPPGEFTIDNSGNTCDHCCDPDVWACYNTYYGPSTGQCSNLCSGTSGSTGSCFPIVATKCAGTGAPIGTQGLFPCPMIDGQPATQALVGQQIKHDGTMVPGGANPSVWTVDSVDLNTDNGPTYQGMNAFPNSSLTTQGAQCASTGSAGCDDSDFDVTASCADANLINSPIGNIGGANSWTTWLNAQMNAFNGNAGCNQFGAIQNWTLAQIAPTANCPALPGSPNGQYGGENNQGNCHPLIGVKRKFAKAKWAYCMSQLCAGGSQAGC